MKKIIIIIYSFWVVLSILAVYSVHSVKIYDKPFDLTKLNKSGVILPPGPYVWMSSGGAIDGEIKYQDGKILFYPYVKYGEGLTSLRYDTCISLIMSCIGLIIILIILKKYKNPNILGLNSFVFVITGVVGIIFVIISTAFFQEPNYILLLILALFIFALIFGIKAKTEISKDLNYDGIFIAKFGLVSSSVMLVLSGVFIIISLVWLFHTNTLPPPPPLPSSP